MFNNIKIMIFYAEFQAKVMKYLIKQDQRLENIEKTLLNLTSSSVGVAREISPISSLEELHNLEEKIVNEEEFNKLVNKFLCLFSMSI